MSTTLGAGSNSLEFPMRQRTRLRVSISRLFSDGTRQTSHNLLSDPDDGSLDGALRAAQAEVVEQEVFAALIREASGLPTASAEVSERLILIDAAQNTELRFELVGLLTLGRSIRAHIRRWMATISATTTDISTHIVTWCTRCSTSCAPAPTGYSRAVVLTKPTLHQCLSCSRPRSCNQS